VLGEEASVRTDKPQLWVCDPIDGTNGFTVGEPTSVFSLAYVVDGVPMLAVSLDPYQDLLYTAVKGKGAHCNGRPIHVSSRSLADKAVVIGPGSFGEIERTVDLYHAIAAKGARVRMFGGLVFKGNLAAEGKIDGILFPYSGAHDIAAVKLIVEEAGGRVTDIQGHEQRYDRPLNGAVISNGVIHDELLAAVNDFGVETFLDLGRY
jgi:myo-inositol-1(or 4)-monophosphatase